jgi:hypothetical protein
MIKYRGKMMDHKISLYLATGLLACNISTAQAALIDYGNGLIYDDILDISWLADANLAATNVFGVAGVAEDGTMTWDTGFDWIAALNSNAYMGYTGWRMPTVDPVNGVNFEYTISYDGSTDRGFNNTSTANELSHLFYVSLGNLGYCTTSNATGLPQEDCEVTPNGEWGLQNTGPFTNMEVFRYWTDTENDTNTTRAFDMDFTFGQVGTGGKIGGKHVWALLDGNPMAVPLPATAWLFASGLIGLAAASRRRQRRTSQA